MARITSSQRMAATSRRPGGPVRFGAPLGRGGVIGPAGPANFVVATLCFFCRGDSEGGGAGGGTQGCSGFPTTPRALTVWLGSHLGAVSHWRAWPPDVRAGPTHRCGTCLQAIVCCFPASLVGGGVASGTGRQQSLHHPPSPTLPKWGVAIPLRAPLRARPRDPALSPPVRGTPPPAQATATPPRAARHAAPPARGEVVVGVECVRRAAWSGRVCAACPQTTWQEWCGGGPTPACQHQQQRPHGSAGRCASSVHSPLLNRPYRVGCFSTPLFL